MLRQSTNCGDGTQACNTADSPPAGQIECGDGVHKARGEAPEAPVAEASVLLYLHQLLRGAGSCVTHKSGHKTCQI